MNILIYIDQKLDEYPAASFVSRLAKIFRVEVTFLYILGDDESQDDGEAVLAHAVESLVDVAAAATLLRWGEPVGVLLSEARQHKYDLLVLHSGREVIEKIISQSIYPAVLILRGELQISNRVLVCTGGPEGHPKVIEAGADMGQVLDAKVTLLHVAAGSVPSMYTGLSAFDESLEDLLKTDTPVARHLRSCAEVLDDHAVEGEIELRRGVPIEEIEREARLGAYDLVVVGRSRFFNGWKGMLLGDMTLPILNQVQTSVLIVGEKALT